MANGEYATVSFQRFGKLSGVLTHRCLHVCLCVHAYAADVSVDSVHNICTRVLIDKMLLVEFSFDVQMLLIHACDMCVCIQHLCTHVKHTIFETKYIIYNFFHISICAHL